MQTLDPKIESEFDKNFCVIDSDGIVMDAFFDIEEWRNRDYIKCRKPLPSEIKQFLATTLARRDEELRESIERLNMEYHGYGIPAYKVLALLPQSQDTPTKI